MQEGVEVSWIHYIWAWWMTLTQLIKLMNLRSGLGGYEKETSNIAIWYLSFRLHTLTSRAECSGALSRWTVRWWRWTWSPDHKLSWTWWWVVRPGQVCQMWGCQTTQWTFSQNHLPGNLYYSISYSKVKSKNCGYTVTCWLTFKWPTIALHVVNLALCHVLVV